MKESMKNLQETSIDQYNRKIKKFNDWISQKKYKRVTFKILRQYFVYLRFTLKYGEANLHAHKFAIFKSIQEFYEDKHDYKTIAVFREFFRSLEYRIKPAVVDLNQLPTLKEVVQIMAYASKKEFVIIFFLYITAFRNHELRKVLLTDCKINSKKNKVTIIIEGKNRKRRAVTIPYWLFSDIKKEYNGKVYLFESKDNKPLMPTTVQFLVRQAAKRVGIKKTVTPKILRISLLNHIYYSIPGISPDWMRERFGHTDATRERWYRLFTNKDNAQFSRFENKFIKEIKKISGKRLIA